MDIMNNMTVSTSKLTFSLIAIAALLVSGSAFLDQDAYAGDAPEFTAIHLNTTATHITFDRAVNGTLTIADWGIRIHTTADDGDITYDVAISDIQNATSAGIGQTDASAADELHSYRSSGGLDGAKGFINGTDIVLIHAAIPTDATYFINYTNNPSSSNNQTANVATQSAADKQGSGAIHSSGGIASLAHKTGGEGSSLNKFLKIGSNATAKDWIVPTASSAGVFKDNPKQVRILMSETIGNVNSTLAEFTMTTSGGGNDAVPTVFLSANGTDNKYIYITLQNPASISDVLTITYAPSATTQWITDAIDTTKYPTSGPVGSTEWNLAGHGNKLAGFTVSITNWLEKGMYGDVTTCYDCSPPTVTEVQVSLDSSTPITVNDDNQVHVSAGIGDSVSVMITVADNMGADTIPFAGLYTNFGETPDNLFYSNNFDSTKQMSTSYYEWNVNTDDIAFDNDGAITWTDATAKVNPDRTQTFTYTMTINDSIESSQVWVDLGDKSGNYAKLALPITLEVSGAPGLTFASDDSQKVVSFFNESILLAIVSQWTSTSSDDATNVEQLSSVLGIESQLPTWTTDLASWVADDKIDVADMIVAVEYVINQ
jgi:hypothetical protein